MKGDTVRGEILRVRGGERDSERREGETEKRRGRDNEKRRERRERQRRKCGKRGGETE